MLTQEQQLLFSDKDTLSKDGQYDDLAKLSFLTEDILLEQLKQRYEKDVIYVSYFSLTRHRIFIFLILFRHILEISSLLSIHFMKQVSIPQR